MATGISWARAVVRFLRAYAGYAKTGVNTDEGQADMRRLFRMTNGRFNDLLGRMHRIAHPARRLPQATGILGDGHETASSAADALRRDGFFRFDTRIPVDLIERLRTLGAEQVQELAGLTENVTFRLPKTLRKAQ